MPPGSPEDAGRRSRTVAARRAKSSFRRMVQAASFANAANCITRESGKRARGHCRRCRGSAVGMSSNCATLRNGVVRFTTEETDEDPECPIFHSVVRAGASPAARRSYRRRRRANSTPRSAAVGSGARAMATTRAPMICRGPRWLRHTAGTSTTARHAPGAREGYKPDGNPEYELRQRRYRHAGCAAGQRRASQRV